MIFSHLLRSRVLSTLAFVLIAGTEAVALADPPAESGSRPPANTESGYIPGSRRAIDLGLSPYAPNSPALPGGLTTPFGAPTPSDEWVFSFKGYMSAALRVSRGSRDFATPDQHVSTFHGLPRIVDAYGMFSGTNSPQGSWVDLTFEYGNKFVTAHVKLTTWKPSRATDWTALGSQNTFDEAYLTFRAPPIGKLNINWTTGAFRNTYGGLGQWGVGQYNAHIIGMPFGVGETLAAQYELDEKYTLHFEDGVMGRMGKAPADVIQLADNAASNGAVPSSWVHHVHAGLSIKGEIPLVAGLHWLTNWAQDERDQHDDPKTYWVNEANRPDPRMDIYGADFRMLNNRYGNAAIAASYANAHNATLLTGLNYFGSYTGEHMTKRFFGPRGGGTAKMLIVGVEYVLSWARLLRSPDVYTEEAPDLTTSVFADYASVNSLDPDFDGRRLYKFGAEATYRFFPWLSVSARADHVVPNSKDSEETFNVISPKVIFKSDWLSHEQVTLAYTRWFYGAHTHAEFPDNFTRGQLDNEMFALTFGMWF